MKFYYLSLAFFIFIVPGVLSVNYIDRIPYACEDGGSEYVPVEVHEVHIKGIDTEWFNKVEPDLTSLFNGVSSDTREVPFNIFDDIGIPFRFKVAQIDGQPLCCADQPRYCGYEDGYLETLSFYLVVGNEEYPLNTGHGTGSSGSLVIIDYFGDNIFDYEENWRYVAQPPNRVPELSHYGYGWFGFNIYRDIGTVQTSQEDKERMIEKVIEAIDLGSDISFKVVAHYDKSITELPDIPDFELTKELGEFTNCIFTGVDGPVKVTTSRYKDAMSIGEFYDILTPVEYGVEPYNDKLDSFFSYFYLGDPGKADEVSGCKDALAYRIINDVNDEIVIDDKYYIKPSDVNGNLDVHMFSHIFAKISDENVLGRVFYKETNCRSYADDRWIWYSESWPGCYYDSLLRPSESSIMYLNQGIPAADKFNLVSCGYVNARLKGITYSEAVRDCYRMSYALMPNLGFPLIMPDGGFA